MNTVRHRRAGFTLTEILMAVGILTIGLTMVATVFPVAVDQNRQSYDLTQASLCARNAAASMRMRRFDVLKAMRPAGTDITDVTSAPSSILTDQLLVYDPATFLYGNSSGVTTVDRTYSNVGLWTAGRFAPRLYLTRIPVTPPAAPSVPSWTARGPYRVSIVVFRSRGKDPGNTVSTLVAGDYVTDITSPSTGVEGRGETYLVDHRETTGTGTSATANYITATGRQTAVTATSFGSATPQGPQGVGTLGAFGQPGAAIAFTTFFGD